MPRLMSVSMTKQAVIDRTKSVTRRKGWAWLKPGARLTLVEKAMGLKKGETVVRLAEVEVVSVTREPLDRLLIGYAIDGSAPSFAATAIRWAEEEMAREGFPGMHPRDFINTYFVDAQGMDPSDEITRIEWRYLDNQENPHD